MALGQWRGKLALVTGASSGIGTEFAKLLAAAGCHLVLTARRRDRLEALAAELRETHSVEVKVVDADLGTAKGASVITDFLQAGNLEIDILVNNAGFGIAGEFHETSAERLQGMLQVNIVSLVALTRTLLDGMRARRSGTIIMVGSVNSFLPVPHFAVYSATKAFVKSFGEALAKESAGSGVSVTNVHPGGTRTEFVEVAGQKLPLLFEKALMTPRQVAKTGLASAHGGAVSVVVGLMNQLTVLMFWLMPPFVLRWFAKNFFSRLH